MSIANTIIKVIGILCITVSMKTWFKYLKYSTCVIGIDFILAPILYIFGLFCIFDFEVI